MSAMDASEAPGSVFAQEFVRSSGKYLSETYVPRLERALAVLPAEDLWWQPHAGALSFGQILRHLEGNVRQWVLSGLGGEADQRVRASEFDGPDARTGGELLAALRETVASANRTVDRLGEATLLSEHTIQGFTSTGLAALYHVVEHFSWHCGQAVWIAKARAGAAHGLAFFDDSAINAARND